VRSWRAPCKGGAFQWVQAPPGWRLRSGTRLIDPSLSEECSYRRPTASTSCAVALVVALQAQGQATQGRSLSTLAPLRALRARTPVPAWARRAVGEGVSLVREPDGGNLHVRFDERDVETESGLNH
jgi:hypothetical protein